MWVLYTAKKSELVGGGTTFNLSFLPLRNNSILNGALTVIKRRWQSKGLELAQGRSKSLRSANYPLGATSFAQRQKELTLSKQFSEVLDE